MTYLRFVGGRTTQLARRWITAYSEHRDDDLVALAHPEIVVRPRRGQGARRYQGIDGVRRWLADAGDVRPEYGDLSIEPLDDRRVIAEGSLDGVTVVALIECRDDKVARVSVYLSDRELLERVGVIPRGRFRRNVTHDPTA